MSYDEEQQRMKFTVTGKVSGSTATARLTVEAETFGEAEAIAKSRGIDVESIEPVGAVGGGEPTIVDSENPLTNALDGGSDAPVTPKARANTDGDRTSPDNRAAIFAIALGAVGILIFFFILASRGSSDDHHYHQSGSQQYRTDPSGDVERFTGKEWQPTKATDNARDTTGATPVSSSAANKNMVASAQVNQRPVWNFIITLENNSEYALTSMDVSVDALGADGSILWTEQFVAKLDIRDRSRGTKMAYPGSRTRWVLDRLVPLQAGQQFTWRIVQTRGHKVR